VAKAVEVKGRVTLPVRPATGSQWCDARSVIRCGPPIKEVRMSAEPSSAPAPAVAAVPVGYASRLTRHGATNALWAGVASCAVGLVLLGIALGALVSIAGLAAVRAGVGFAPRNAGPMLAVFVAVCTLTGLVFLVVGLRWLFAAAQP
jgi:hypothetical protein